MYGVSPEFQSQNGLILSVVGVKALSPGGVWGNSLASGSGCDFNPKMV